MDELLANLAEAIAGCLSVELTVATWRKWFDGNGLTKLQNSTYIWHGLPQKAAKKGEKAGFSAVDFSGELQVTDTEKFRQLSSLALRERAG